MQLVCRRCLLMEMEGTYSLREMIDQYIEAIPEDKKTATEVYRARLEICKACEELTNGMCKLCGCYVELKAAKALQRCPHVPSKWTCCEID